MFGDSSLYSPVVSSGVILRVFFAPGWSNFRSELLEQLGRGLLQQRTAVAPGEARRYPNYRRSGRTRPGLKLHLRRWRDLEVCCGYFCVVLQDARPPYQWLIRVRAFRLLELVQEVPRALTKTKSTTNINFCSEQLCVGRRGGLEVVEGWVGEGMLGTGWREQNTKSDL